MNIKITYNWLLEYLDTDADPYELQKYLSLCGPSIERVTNIDDDYVFDIEVTSNRVDMASVFGVAQEATAILPQFGKKAKLRFNPLEKYTFEQLQAEPAPHKKLNITITDHDLVPRFTAIVISQVAIGPAPDVIKKRLQMCDIKSINNIVDISNYLMLALGQPVHMFDYDKIKGHTMIVRESKKGEKVTTLDDKEITLPGGDIVIEDGDGRLIDLCGIMGGANSAISSDTNTVVFFVQNYNKRRIRKTSMLTAQRSVAATYFEKGLDSERVEPTFVYGIELLNSFSGGGIADSELYDMYPHPYHPKQVITYLSDIQRIMGIPVKQNIVIDILHNLGFTVTVSEQEEFSYPDNVKFTVTVPSYRADDVNIKEDIAEEVARVYGYQNIPSELQPPAYVIQPKDMELFFSRLQKVKYFLKHIGLHEVMNYSMVSKDLLEKLDLNPNEHLKLANTISTDIEYMRSMLIPSLIFNLKENLGKKEQLKLFEIAKTYKPRQNELPDEQYTLAIAANSDYFDVKGIVEALLNELNISDFSFKIGSHYLLSDNVRSELVIGSQTVGVIGQLKKTYQYKFDIKDLVVIAEIDFRELIKHSKLIKTYLKPISFATIKLDLTVKQSPKLSYQQIKKLSCDSELVTNLEVLDTYGDNLTLRYFFSSPDRNITEDEAKQELEKIKHTIESHG